jgi:hypothetical protein
MQCEPLAVCCLRQILQRSHEEQLRAALARESSLAEERGRKLAAQEACVARDGLQKKLSDTEAEFRLVHTFPLWVSVRGMVNSGSGNSAL